MKTFKAPEGYNGSVSIGGQSFAVNRKGCVNVSDDVDTSQIAAHGFVRVGDDADTESAAPTAVADTVTDAKKGV
ncbi:MAG: hypothetical protein JO253_08080 [Alphaproteobacteria bacterium]|nr:hypothetical protein [Alphaproteobacteria bacterium]